MMQNKPCGFKKTPRHNATNCRFRVTFQMVTARRIIKKYKSKSEYKNANL